MSSKKLPPERGEEVDDEDEDDNVGERMRMIHRGSQSEELPLNAVRVMMMMMMSTRSPERGELC